MCSVHASEAHSLLSIGETAKEEDFLALWDTGAQGSAITELAAKRLNLIQKGVKYISGLGGTFPKKTYLIDLILPNKIMLKDLSVTELDNPLDEKGNKIEPFGILIGMDIINMGDFSISNFEGKTLMSFRMPSIHSLDFVKEQQIKQRKR